jgi:hypothetical protein
MTRWAAVMEGRGGADVVGVSVFVDDGVTRAVGCCGACGGGGVRVEILEASQCLLG